MQASNAPTRRRTLRMLTNGLSSLYTSSWYTSSAMISNFSLYANFTISWRLLSGRHWPVGLPGLMTTSARGHLPAARAALTAARRLSTDSAQPSDSSRSYGTSVPPAAAVSRGQGV